MGFNGILLYFNGIYDGYPLVNCYITMENHHAISGKTHYFDWAIFNSKVLNYQRVINPC